MADRLAHAQDWFDANIPQITNPGTSGPSRPIASGQTAAGQDAQALIQQWQQSHPYGSPGSSIQDLNAFLNANGVQSSIPTHAGGTQLSTDKIVLPDQSVWDISNDNGWQSGIQDGYWVNGQPSATPGVVTQAPSSNTGLPSGYDMGTFTGGGQYPLASVTGPGFMQPFTTPFVAPTDITMQNDPGYQARLKFGTDAIQKSAAANGTLLTGGTLKDLTQFAQDYASNEYNNIYNRALGEYNTAYNIFNNNGQNQFNRLYQLGALGENAAAQTGNAASGYGNSAANLITDKGSAAAAGDVGVGNAVNSGLTTLGAVWPSRTPPPSASARQTTASTYQPTY